MNYKVFVLAIVVLIVSCKSKDTESPLPQPPATHPHGPNKHRLPPGHEKKLHGDKSARNYAPGHRKAN
jgi:hypothetical protein